ncbi:MAG: hypothetical protein ACFE95_14260 [Candidatus Hodarchaeota archaeon]
MIEKRKRKQYDTIKEFNGQRYTGMRVGGKHSWNYQNGIWNETKVSPDKWEINFICNKYRTHQAPRGTGALNNTQYHWYIIADQLVNKIDANTYNTTMTGLKYKIAHKKPNWNRWSYQYKGETYEDKVIAILEEIITHLKTRRKGRELTNFIKM